MLRKNTPQRPTVATDGYHKRHLNFAASRRVDHIDYIHDHIAVNIQSHCCAYTITLLCIHDHIACKYTIMLNQFVGRSCLWRSSRLISGYVYFTQSSTTDGSPRIILYKKWSYTPRGKPSNGCRSIFSLTSRSQACKTPKKSLHYSPFNTHASLAAGWDLTFDLPVNFLALHRAVLLVERQKMEICQHTIPQCMFPRIYFSIFSCLPAHHTLCIRSSRARV